MSSGVATALCKRRGDGRGESEFHRRAAVDGRGLHLRGLQGRGRAEEEGREELHAAPAEGRALETFVLVLPRRVSERSRVQALSAVFERYCPAAIPEV